MKASLLTQLNIALERVEFEIYYQPYFGLVQKEIGMEALIRWNHPQFGILSPTSFLGVAEEMGLILEIEKWVLSQSIQEVTALQQRGLEDLSLSVNISALQFENPNFPDLVFALLKRFSFSPAQLILEVTERFLIKQDNVEIIKQLKKFGIRISIDDFGSSYSSLQYLKDFPIDELKIDRSFITNIDTDFKSQKIVEMIIMLGHQLNLKIVAEGVESKKQLQLLKGMNCDKVQGFLFSEPIPLATFEQKYAYWTSSRIE